MLDVFHHEQRREFVHQYTCLAAAWTRGHHDIFGSPVVYDTHLLGGQRTENLLEFGRSDVCGYFLLPALEIFVEE